MEPSEAIRTIRRRTGMSLRALGKAAGTSASTLSAYEHGRKSPTWSTLSGIAAAGGMQASVDLLVPGVAVEAEAARWTGERLVAALAREPDDGDRLRLVLDFAGQWAEVDLDRRWRSVAREPGLVGDVRWDACVAGVVEHLCWHDGLAAPGWVDAPTRFVDGFWWPIDLPSVRPWALDEAPASLLRHGVVLSRADLDRV